MRVLALPSGCPQVNLGSHVGTLGAANPLVYLDGTRTIGTCVLDHLRAEIIASVEIYPMGSRSAPATAPTPKVKSWSSAGALPVEVPLPVGGKEHTASHPVALRPGEG